MSKPVAFVIGWGKGVGQGVTTKLKAEGFSIAVGARRLDENEVQAQGFLPIKLDVTVPQEIENAFAKLEKELGPASLVVYNASTFTARAPAGDPLSADFDLVLKDVFGTGLNAYLVAQKANQGFDKLPPGTHRAFIATGNLLPFIVLPALHAPALGKRVLAHIVEVAATAYEGSGKRFYYAHQVTKEGGPIIGPAQPQWSPETHGSVYYRLWKKEEQGRWDVRFTSDGELLAHY